ncbi:MAG TPA: sulfite exporter TauE/SafE family protein [Tepidisphaeraceae bacterium]|jgi:hypothetical protein|nr:sulfite exporter TauE/SafE family protein [Tepidisphaeraceae bacterium]
MTPWWLIVFLAIALIGVTKSGFGAGVGLMIVPMTVVAMNRLNRGGAAATLGLMLPLLIVGDVIAVWQYRQLFNLTIIARMLPGSVVGVLIGGAVLWAYRLKAGPALTAFIEIEIGFESVLLVGLHWYRLWRAADRTFRPSLARSSAVGAFAGASSTLAHAAGPIIALHLLPQKLDRQIFVGTCAVYFFLVNTAKVPIFFAAGQFRVETLWLSLELAPLVLVGAAFGFWVTKRMNDQVFSKIVYALTFCLGWYLLVSGAMILGGRAV